MNIILLFLFLLNACLFSHRQVVKSQKNSHSEKYFPGVLEPTHPLFILN
jgi:hypothetical protein